MDRTLKIGFCVILIGIYWISMADSQSQCKEAEYHEDKCQVCARDKDCPRCGNKVSNVECRHDNRCRCKEGYGLNNQGTDCVIATNISNYQGNCDALNNIFCNDDDFLLCLRNCVNCIGTCICRPEHHYDADLTKCISDNPLIFDVCSESAQPDLCNKTQPLKCDNAKHRCVVQKGFKYNCETKLYEERKGEYGEECDDDDPCNPDNYLECRNEECVCKEGLFEYDEDENRCVICEKEEDIGLMSVLILSVVVYVGILGEVGLIVWLVRRHRRVQEGSSNQKKSKKKNEKKLRYPDLLNNAFVSVPSILKVLRD